ncbi:hypothetical protein [Nonomuraea sp. NPDC048826]|uniref:hypothetical protein n=1 Tax=Nonomuraea sp. NPDC048826 TaxID=3364347 RepID=UPI00371D5CA8
MDQATPMPRPVRTAVILLWIDIALMALAVVILLLIAPAVAGQAPQSVRFYLIIAWSVVLLALTVFLTIKLMARRRWVRVGLITIMALNVLGYVVNLFSDGGLGLGAILGLCLAVAVIGCLLQQDSRAYLDK